MGKYGVWPSKTDYFNGIVFHHFSIAGLDRSQWDFMSLFSTHLDFKISAEEFYPHKTLSTPIKLLSSLSLLIWCHVSIINIHETLMEPH
jgi:hypothetical protein